MTLENLLFTLLLLCALLVFSRRIYLLFAMVLLGQGENRYDRLHDRLKALAVYGFGQKRVVEKPFGLNHFLLFWGFVVLQLAVNIEFIINGIFPRFTLGFIGRVPYSALGLIADATSVVVLLVVVIAMVRRTFFRPWYIESKPGAYVILILVGLLMIGDLGIDATSVAAGRAQTQYLPVSKALSGFFTGVTHDVLPVIEGAFWWLHAVVLLAFICYIPYSKHLHILTALINCFFRRLGFPNSMGRLNFRKGEVFGVSQVTQLTWKDLYDFLSCTECGRCAEMCPATDTGKVLNPMQVVLEGKANLEANGMKVLHARSYDSVERVDVRTVMPIPLIGEDEERNVKPEAIWDCTTCGACVEKCPVFIEQFPKLLKMRRHLVMEKVDFPRELVTLFENVEQRSNPYGMAPAERDRWTKGLDIPFISKGMDVEYLLFAGCVPSFNPRMRSVLAAIAEALKQGRISFAILGKEEQCCGDPLRRTGNEYVFARLVKQNIDLFARYHVGKMITFCPHCYNTFKNDYPAFGSKVAVYHHTQLLSMLLQSGAIAAEADRKTNERVVIHDACYLGRYNGLYTEPRRIIKAATGLAPIEMERSERESFCCGAGGGRLWMHESKGIRINTERTRQALAKEPSIIATSCPYCLIMFEDGLKDEKAEERVKVMDVSELLVSGIERDEA